MKQRRFIPILAVALLLGGVAGYLALQFLAGQAAAPIPGEVAAPTGKMVVATADLPLGTVLRAEDVRVIDWHSPVLPVGYYGSTAEVIGRGLITPVAANEPLISAKLADMESGGGLPIVIPEGMRALSVRVDEVIGVAGFVLPGTRVDVLLTITPQGGSEIPVTRIILQNIQTLASGQTIQRDADGTPQTVSVVTLLVSPEQAERLTLASTEGRIQLALRNTLDMADVSTPGVLTTALIAPPRSGPQTSSGTAVRVAAPAVSTQNASSAVVEIYRGGERTLSTFQNP